ncbi:MULTISPECIES: helix-turn-helix domain-containing protein [Clostridia]|uniref:helix-turn-helix domain-containing protein n=1 Tax=Clostridia TaxID=186801 RepID=UPI000822EDE3|nr:helix-turn-helix transcriptional regulator [Clostridium sp. BSD2780061688st1 E8]SCI87317.1 HTH-type transcriptional regulator sinR [uncultured Clostridium sp.]
MGNYTRYYNIIGENIAYYRKKKHLTQEGLALKANISRVHISHIEAKNVHKAPSLDILFRLCDILDIEPYQLFKEREDM